MTRPLGELYALPHWGRSGRSHSHLIQPHYTDNGPVIPSTRLDIGTEKDIYQLDRAAQLTIFTLRTEHCQLLSHLHRLKISRSDECPCGTGPHPLPPPPPPTPLSPTTSCSPALTSTPEDSRHGQVRWMPTGSFEDRLRHCGILRPLPYSPDWRSSMAGNVEEKEFLTPTL